VLTLLFLQLGSISKNDAKAFQLWAAENFDLPILHEFVNAKPAAELLPLSAGIQDDENEAEMGMTYDELQTFGRLRKEEKLGPWGVYSRLLSD
jgi:NAD+ synthase (glutamine-hydrolysing)